MLLFKSLHEGIRSDQQRVILWLLRLWPRSKSHLSRKLLSHTANSQESEKDILVDQRFFFQISPPGAPPPRHRGLWRLSSSPASAAPLSSSSSCWQGTRLTLLSENCKENLVRVCQTPAGAVQRVACIYSAADEGKLRRGWPRLIQQDEILFWLINLQDLEIWRHRREKHHLGGHAC